MLIEYLDKDQNTIAIAITGEAMAIDHELVMQLWIRLQQIGNIDLPVSRVLMQAIATLLPRRDITGKGFSIEGLNNKQLEALFMGENCELIKEHKPRLEPKKRDITTDGAPIATSGNPTADILAQMTRQFDGKFSEALLAINNMSYNTLDAFQRTYAECCRDPEERTKEYVLQKYNEQLENDQKFKMAALGMDL